MSDDFRDMWTYDAFTFKVKKHKAKPRHGAWWTGKRGEQLVLGSNLWATKQEAAAAGMLAAEDYLARCEADIPRLRNEIEKCLMGIEDSQREVTRVKAYLAKAKVTP